MPCAMCNGLGILQAAHGTNVKGMTCFACNGTGKKKM